MDNWRNIYTNVGTCVKQELTEGGASGRNGRNVRARVARDIRPEPGPVTVLLRRRAGRRVRERRVRLRTVSLRGAEVSSTTSGFIGSV